MGMRKVVCGGQLNLPVVEKKAAKNVLEGFCKCRIRNPLTGKEMSLIARDQEGLERQLAHHKGFRRIG